MAKRNGGDHDEHYGEGKSGRTSKCGVDLDTAYRFGLTTAKENRRIEKEASKARRVFGNR